MSTWLSRGNSGRSLSRPRLSGSPPRCSWSSRKQLLSKLSHSLRKPSQISPSPLSLLLFPSPYYATALSPPHLFTSPPWCPTSRHALTLSLSLSLILVIPVPVHRTVSLFSFLLFFHSSVERASFPRRTPVVRPSQLVRLRSRPASVSLCGPTSRECTNRKVEVHTRVCGNAVSECEKRSGRVAMDPRELFPSAPSLSLSLRRAHPFFRSGRQFRERKTRGERRRDRLENESRRNARKEEEEVRRGEGRGEIAWNAAKETQERAIYGAA